MRFYLALTHRAGLKDVSGVGRKDRGTNACILQVCAAYGKRDASARSAAASRKRKAGPASIPSSFQQSAPAQARREALQPMRLASSSCAAFAFHKMACAICKSPEALWKVFSRRTRKPCWESNEVATQSAPHCALVEGRCTGRAAGLEEKRISCVEHAVCSRRMLRLQPWFLRLLVNVWFEET